jgi:hypothetical protein
VEAKKKAEEANLKLRHTENKPEITESLVIDEKNA